MYNNKTMTIKLSRGEVCDLLIACTACSASSGANKWDELHSKLERMIDDFDKKHSIE